MCDQLLSFPYRGLRYIAYGYNIFLLNETPAPPGGKAEFDIMIKVHLLPSHKTKINTKNINSDNNNDNPFSNTTGK